MFRLGLSGWTLYPGARCELCGQDTLRRDGFLARQILRRLQGDPLVISAIRGILAGEMIPEARSRLSSDQTIERLAVLVDRRRWHLHAPTVKAGPAAASSSEAAWTPPPGSNRASTRKAMPGPAERPPLAWDTIHWIEIQLIGEDGKPIPSERYRIQLPNGRIEEGQLDGNGMARVDNINPAGACKVSFPELDSEAWMPA
jgi:hypothetical protein